MISAGAEAAPELEAGLCSDADSEADADTATAAVAGGVAVPDAATVSGNAATVSGAVALSGADAAAGVRAGAASVCGAIQYATAAIPHPIASTASAQGSIDGLAGVAGPTGRRSATGGVGLLAWALSSKTCSYVRGGGSTSGGS